MMLLNIRDASLSCVSWKHYPAKIMESAHLEDVYLCFSLIFPLNISLFKNIFFCIAWNFFYLYFK